MNKARRYKAKHRRRLLRAQRNFASAWLTLLRAYDAHNPAPPPEEESTERDHAG